MGGDPKPVKLTGPLLDPLQPTVPIRRPALLDRDERIAQTGRLGTDIARTHPNLCAVAN